MSENGAHLQIAVLCGAGDAELWPIARADEPLDLVAQQDGTPSLLAATIERYRSFTDNPFLLVIQEGLEERYQEHLIEHELLDFDEYEVLTVPGNRGSAFSIALAAVHVKLRDPESIMLVTPSNQRIEADERFEIAIDRAYEVADTCDSIALLAVEPTGNRGRRAYVKMGVDLKGHPGAHRIRGFVDSPNPAQSLRLADMGALWSTDIYLVRATTALALLREVDEGSGSARIAETASFLTALGCNHWTTDAAREVVASLPDTSFSACVMERTSRIAAIPTVMAFNVFESLDTLDEEVEADRMGNRIVGHGLAVRSRGTTIDAAKKLVVTLGTRNLLVIDTPDALLVADKDAIGALSDVTRALEEAQAPERIRHTEDNAESGD